jgi:hypothetical protein
LIITRLPKNTGLIRNQDIPIRGIYVTRVSAVRSYSVSHVLYQKAESTNPPAVEESPVTQPGTLCWFGTGADGLG